MEQGFDKLERKLSLMQWKYVKKLYTHEEDITEEEREQYIKVSETVKILANNELFKEGHKINQASYKKRNRLEKRIAKYISESTCIFLTLTFKDEVLESTTEETRRRYVTRVLKQMSNKYIANIDYGKKNEREHYHAIVVCDQVDRKLWCDYGAINFERIKQTSDSVKLSKYIVKLTNHAMKETVRQNKVIYSKI